MGVKTKGLVWEMNLRNIGQKKVSFHDLLSSASAYSQPVVLLFIWICGGEARLNGASGKEHEVWTRMI